MRLLVCVSLLIGQASCDDRPRRGGGDGPGEGEGEGAEGEGAEGEGAEGEGAEGEGAEGEGAEGEGAEGEGEGIQVDQLGLYRSGTRLKAVVGRTPDGAQSFRGWWDTELQTRCNFGTGEDGGSYCFPVVGAASGFDYEDERCTIPLISVSARQEACISLEFADRSVTSSNNCWNMDREIYRVGERIGPIQTYYKSVNSSCHPVENDGDLVFYHLGEKLSLSALVREEEQILD
ncbi:MAG: hypothetical protein RBU45_14285 [Myxococcota bacterium]|nr:hypothetical protein [Myxococcota bacterium]